MRCHREAMCGYCDSFAAMTFTGTNKLYRSVPVVED